MCLPQLKRQKAGRVAMGYRLSSDAFAAGHGVAKV
jgi:hypothetical protein